MIFCLHSEIQFELDSLLPFSWSQLLEKLALPNIKWICPTAPTRPVAILGGFPRTAWFDVGELLEDSPDDFEGLDASVVHIANLLSTGPADLKLGIGGFSIGAATALYSATCFAQEKYGNGIAYPVNLRAIVGLSGWLPGSKTLRKKIEGSQEAARRAAPLPILLCYGIYMYIAFWTPFFKKKKFSWE